MDTLQLGFTLNAYQEDSRWIKKIFPFVHVKNEDLFPNHQIDIGPLVGSLAEPGEHFIVTCTCGYPECGGIWTGIRVDHEGDLIRWTVKEPEPGLSLAFNAAQYKRAIFRLIDDLALIVEEPDGYNEYGFHGFDLQRFTEIAQRRNALAPAATGSGDTCSAPVHNGYSAGRMLADASGLPSGSAPVRDWFSDERMPVDATELPPAWNGLPEAIEAASPVRICYAGGTRPGAERLIRPLALFRVAGYDATYLQAIDTELEEERVFRLDRMEPVPATPTQR